MGLKVTVANSAMREKLLEEIGTHSLGKPWIHKYDPTVFGAWGHLTHACANKSGNHLEKIFAVVEFIIDVPLKLTLYAVDVRALPLQGRWPLCFLGAMCWLGVFSYCMLQLAIAIHHAIPTLTHPFLGVTICAI